MGVDHLPAGQHHTDGVHPPMNVALATPLFVLGGVFVILFVGRLAITLHRRRRLRAILKDENQSRFTERNGFMAWINKHVLHAPLLSTRHSREFNLGGIHMGNLPLRIETMLLTGYLGINVAFFVCLIDWWEDYEELMYQLKYAAGHLAVMNTPALVLTAGRNNPLIPLLGIQFDAFNLLHRWVGRLAVVGAVVHVACVIASKTAEVGEKTTQHIFHVPFYIYGLVAFLAFLLIAVQSISPLRHAFYEAFLHFHILLAIAAFVGLWYHLRNLAMQWVLLGTIVLWGLERTARLGSLIWRNWGKQRTIADVEVLPGNVARVNVALTRTWKFKSGQYMYLYIPSLGLWTSHPFSVAWTATEETSVADKADSNDSFNMLLNEKPPRTTVSFLIKRRDGFTCKLLRKAIDSEACRFTATAFAEGPFGGLHSLSSYGTVMLIAGGIGITHPMSYMHEFMEGYSARTVAIRRVNLIWVVRSLDHLTWIQPWMTSLFTHPAVHTKEQHPFQFKGLGVSIHIYVTDRQCSEEYMADKSDSPWAFSAPPGVQVSIGFGKPCFEHIVGKESDSQVGAMAVNVCGPGGMGDDVRKAVRMVQGRKTVDLYEETFSW